jgi:hypothetical protein
MPADVESPWVHLPIFISYEASIPARVKVMCAVILDLFGGQI